MGVCGIVWVVTLIKVPPKKAVLCWFQLQLSVFVP